MRMALLSSLAAKLVRPVALIGAIASAPGGPACRADLLVEVGPVTAAPGSSGSFEVVLANTNAAGGASYSISSDTIVLALQGLTGVTITGATIQTSTPYIYQVSGTSQPGSDPFAVLASPASLAATDAEFDPTGYDVIGPGQIFGLAEVTYSVASNAAVGVVGTISLDGTNFSDADANAIPGNLMGGTFTIAPAVPEPSSFLLVAAGLATCSTIMIVSRNRPAS